LRADRTNNKARRLPSRARGLQLEQDVIPQRRAHGDKENGVKLAFGSPMSETTPIEISFAIATWCGQTTLRPIALMTRAIAETTAATIALAVGFTTKGVCTGCAPVLLPLGSGALDNWQGQVLPCR